MNSSDAPVILVGCQKGGIGRTVLAVNLASMLALSGRRTLLVDLDTKGDASASLGLDLATRGRSAERLGDPWSVLEDTAAVQRPAGLDVWRGGPALDAVAAELARSAAGIERTLARGLSLAKQRYRAIVIDAPPDLGPLARTALAAADVLVVPASAGAFAERALEETISTACRLRADMRLFGVRLAPRAEELPEALAEEGGAGPLGLEMLDCVIAYDPPVLDAAVADGLPVFEYAPASLAARSFLELTREVIAKVLEHPAVAADADLA